MFLFDSIKYIMEIKDNSNIIFTDVKLFKGDFCNRSSPDLLEMCESQTQQTDDEDSTSKYSINSVDTTILGEDCSSDTTTESSGDDDDYLSYSKAPAQSTVSSKDPITIVSESLGSEISDESSSLSTHELNNDETTNSDLSRNEVIPPSPPSLLEHRNSVSPRSSSPKPTTGNSNKRKASQVDVDPDQRHYEEPQPIQTINHPKYHAISSTAEAPKAKRRIVMNKVVYPSSLPTSSDESSSEYIPVINKNKPDSSSSKKLTKKPRRNIHPVIAVAEDDSSSDEMV